VPEDGSAFMSEFDELAVENRRLRHENQQWKTVISKLRTYDHTLEALCKAFDLKEEEPDDHTKRVTAYSIAIARYMGMQKDDCLVIARGASLHDIGKMFIPQSILRKSSKLSEEEMAVVRKYIGQGYEILKNIPFLKEAAEIVHAHQEHFDGTGYPRRLKGEDIPLGSRIVAVANTLEAMTSDRPYRPRQSVESARTEIQLWAGRQFDPQIVEAFLNMPDNIWEDINRF
jgi:HD-GYP domain-containing protein (c-di-GMP phosphodiesterase class II)